MTAAVRRVRRRLGRRATGKLLAIDRRAGKNLLADDLDQLVRQFVRLHRAGSGLDFHVVRIGHPAAVMMRAWR